MNDYERKVNGMAVVGKSGLGLNEPLPYKLPGIKRYGEEQQDKYIEKSYNNILQGMMNQSMDYNREKTGSATTSIRPQSILARSSSVGAGPLNGIGMPPWNQNANNSPSPQ